jgi:hypothetical protein
MDVFLDDAVPIGKVVYAHVINRMPEQIARIS